MAEATAVGQAGSTSHPHLEATLELLPDELLCRIFSFVRICDLLNARAVSARFKRILDDPTFYASGDGPVVGIRDWMGAMGVGGPNAAGGLAAEAMSGAELRANDAIEMHPYDAEEDGIELRNMTQWDSWHANDDEDWVNHVTVTNVDGTYTTLDKDLYVVHLRGVKRGLALLRRWAQVVPIAVLDFRYPLPDVWEHPTGHCVHLTNDDLAFLTAPARDDGAEPASVARLPLWGNLRRVLIDVSQTFSAGALNRAFPTSVVVEDDPLRHVIFAGVCTEGRDGKIPNPLMVSVVPTTKMSLFKYHLASIANLAPHKLRIFVKENKEDTLRDRVPLDWAAVRSLTVRDAFAPRTFIAVDYFTYDGSFMADLPGFSDEYDAFDANNNNHHGHGHHDGDDGGGNDGEGISYAW